MWFFQKVLIKDVVFIILNIFSYPKIWISNIKNLDYFMPYNFSLETKKNTRSWRKTSQYNKIQGSHSYHNYNNATYYVLSISLYLPEKYFFIYNTIYHFWIVTRASCVPQCMNILKITLCFNFYIYKKLVQTAVFFHSLIHYSVAHYS